MKENKLVPFILCLALLFSAVFFSACEKQTRDAPEEAVFSPPLSAAPTAVFRILSSPTDRVVVYEEEALFSASAENYGSAEWFFCDPSDSFSLAAAEASEFFDGLVVVAGHIGNSEVLTIASIPASLNGWFVQCVFYGPTGAIPSEKALISVSGIPEDIAADLKTQAAQGNLDRGVRTQPSNPRQPHSPDPALSPAVSESPASPSDPAVSPSVLPSETTAPTPTPTVSPVLTPIPSPTDKPVPSDPAETPAPSPSPSPAPTPLPTDGPEPTPTPAPSASPPSEHTHSWSPVFSTVHHDAVTEQQWIIDTPATPGWDEETTVYTAVCKCGEEFSSIQAWQSHCSSFFDTPQENDHASYSSYQKPVTTHHPGTAEVGHYETVTVTPAWDEQILDHYVCSCGATRDP